MNRVNLPKAPLSRSACSCSCFEGDGTVTKEASFCHARLRHNFGGGLFGTGIAGPIRILEPISFRGRGEEIVKDSMHSIPSLFEQKQRRGGILRALDAELRGSIANWHWPMTHGGSQAETRENKGRFDILPKFQISFPPHEPIGKAPFPPNPPLPRVLQLPRV